MSCPVNLRGLPAELLEEVFTPENVRVRPMTSSLSTLSFPKSRCALWDGTATGDKVLLHLCAHRSLRVQLTEKALRLAQRHVRHSSRTRLLCFFIGSASVDSDEAGVTVTLDRFDPGRDHSGARVPCAVLPGDVCASCVFTSDPGAPDQSEAELQQDFQTLQQAVAGRQSLDLAQTLRLRLHVVWTQALDSADFSLSWSCVSPATSVHVEPVRAVHVIPTALVRSLTSPARPPPSSRQRGFVTMDQTRKLLLLLESDPKALSLPLVGVWFSGAAQVHSPQIWTWILRFLHSASIQDRAMSESGCFLLLLFASTHRAPQFYQCKATGAGPELQYQLLTGHQRATLYQVASVEGQTLKCDLSSESDSRRTEVFRQTLRAFHSSPSVAPAAGLSVTDQDSGVEDEDLSPRPSPSPHLPPTQTRRIQPSVPELSLLIDGSFSSNHDAPLASSRPQALPSSRPQALPSSRPQAPPPAADGVSPLQLHSTPHSNLLLQHPTCACCNSNHYVCTTIHATPGTDLPQLHQSTPQLHQNTPQLHQSTQQLHQNQIHQSQIHQSAPRNPQQEISNSSSKHSSPSSHHQSPSSRRKSSTSRAHSPRTPPVSQSHPTGIARSQSLPQMTPAKSSSPQHHTPPVTTNVPHSFQPSPSNHANFTPEQATDMFQSQVKTTQMPPPLSIFQTPPNVRSHHAVANMNFSNPPAMNMNFSNPLAANMNFSNPLAANMNFSNPLVANTDSPPQNPPVVPSFAIPSVASASCAHAPAAFPPPFPVACVSRCCEQQGALSSGEAYQLLLQQDRQLRLLQQQVQMLLEAQGKLQSNPTENQTQTKSTASVAVGTGASLFWPEPPPLCPDSSPPPRSVTPLSPSRADYPHSTTSPDAKLQSHDHMPGRRDHAPGPRDHAPGPRDHTPGPRDHAPGPRDHAAGPRDHAAGPCDHTPRPRDHAPGPRDHAAGPRDHTPRPRDHTSGPRDHTPEPRDHTPGPRDHTSGPHDHTPGPCDQAEVRAESSGPGSASPSGLSGVESPVLGESASMYHQEDHQEGHQETFYHDLMTQLNSRLREDEETKLDERESKPAVTKSRQSLDRPPSPSRSSSSVSSTSSASSSVSAPKARTPSLSPASQKKKPVPEQEDVVVSATLRRLQQLGVKLDKRDLSEPDRVQARAVENASTLACINPAAVVSRLSAPDASLSVPDASLSLAPHCSADLSLEANAIALRYLSDRQLTRLSLSTPRPRASANDATVLSPSNMSLATRKYMRKYGLIQEDHEDHEEEEEKEEVPLRENLLPQSQLIRELKPKMKLLQAHRDQEEDKENTRKRSIMGNQGSVGNILDLSRLRQLPKLF